MFEPKVTTLTFLKVFYLGFLDVLVVQGEFIFCQKWDKWNICGAKNAKTKTIHKIR